MFLSPSGCDENPFLFIIVVTSSRNFEAYACKSIRSSWGKSVGKYTSTRESFQVIFVVGCDEVNDERVEKEAKTYEDILRGMFFDNYVSRMNYMQSRLTLLGLKWATSMCNPAYILKVNSESFVNVHETIEWLRTLSDVIRSVVKSLDLYGLYTGYCHMGVKVVRNPQSHYFVPESQWPDKFLPDHSSGVGVVLSRDVAAKMVQIARQMTMIHIDDVFHGVMAQNRSEQCTDQSNRFDLAYTTMLMECENRHVCIIGGVPAKDLFY